MENIPNRFHLWGANVEVRGQLGEINSSVYYVDSEDGTQIMPDNKSLHPLSLKIYF